MTGPRKRPELHNDEHAILVALPTKAFMYTLEQVASMLEVAPAHFKNRMVFYSGRDRMKPRAEDLVAVNLSKANVAPEWRVGEEELIRWLRIKGIKFNQPVKPRAPRRF